MLEGAGAVRDVYGSRTAMRRSWSRLFDNLVLLVSTSDCVFDDYARSEDYEKDGVDRILELATPVSPNVSSFTNLSANNLI